MKDPAGLLKRGALLVLIGVLSLSQVLWADEPVPELRARATDLTGTLNPSQLSSIENKLASFEERKGTQFALLIVPSTKPEEIEQYSIRVVEKWKLGRAKISDGALLLIAKNDRRLRIEVGYGLEGVLTDAASKRIIDEVITPHFKNDDFYGGVIAGFDAMISLVNGEPLPPPAQQGQSSGAEGSVFFNLIFVGVVVGAILRSALGRTTGGLAAGLFTFAVGLAFLSFAAVVVLTIIVMAFTFAAGNGRGGFGGISVGSGGWSSSGGGFSGGGGGFGGGGASGSW